MKEITTKNKPAVRTSAKKALSAVEINRRREWRMDLPLTAEIEGKLLERFAALRDGNQEQLEQILTSAKKNRDALGS